MMINWRWVAYGVMALLFVALGSLYMPVPGSLATSLSGNPYWKYRSDLTLGELIGMPPIYGPPGLAKETAKATTAGKSAPDWRENAIAQKWATHTVRSWLTIRVPADYRTATGKPGTDQPEFAAELAHPYDGHPIVSVVLRLPTNPEGLPGQADARKYGIELWETWAKQQRERSTKAIADSGSQLLRWHPLRMGMLGQWDAATVTFEVDHGPGKAGRIQKHVTFYKVPLGKRSFDLLIVRDLRPGRLVPPTIALIREFIEVQD